MPDTTIPHVGPVDPTKKTSAIDPDGGEVMGLLDKAPSVCLYNDAKFSQGAQVCVGKIRLECGSTGRWFPYGSC